MPAYTLLKRNDLIRAELDSETIERLTRCGYETTGQREADTAELAVEQFRAQQGEPKKPEKPLGLRWMMWVGGSAALVWFTYLIFGLLLPFAFQS